MGLSGAKNSAIRKGAAQRCVAFELGFTNEETVAYEPLANRYTYVDEWLPPLCRICPRQGSEDMQRQPGLPQQ